MNVPEPLADTRFHATAVRLRPMAPPDLRAVRRLEQAAYGAHPPGTPFAREIGNGLAAYAVAEWVGTGHAPRTESGGRRAGPLRLCRGNATPLLGFVGMWFLGDQLHITTLAVDPSVQGRGVATRLMLHAFDTALDADLRTIALEVRASNQRARALYERFGLREVGRRARYYSDNAEDAVIMVTAPLDDPALTARIEALRRIDRVDPPTTRS